ncbi:hypothetical protein SAMN05216214_1254 [Atopomonas hussainii]|uniref:Uncharacterized protein n=2 Tax=Atopomonas hussainii TaxID=1429083 RepID=A0A1H7T820_9GAMM|nr:hypothetical protein SAMN05216214_1254 [Atopomonas hussainii]
MFGIESEVKIHSKKLSWLKPVLEQWLRVHRDYIESNNCDDSLYWYNERANVGALAGAIWRSGGFALEEFGAIKGKEEDESKGRVDLFFQYAGKQVVAEAKQSWVYLTGNKKRDFRSLIDKALNSARSDIIRTQGSLEHQYGLGLVFLPTYTKDLENSKEEMGRFLAEINSTECDFFAWLKNTSGENLISYNNEYCDAVALIGVSV